jgi:hypothetical protein
MMSRKWLGEEVGMKQCVFGRDPLLGGVNEEAFEEI